VKARIVAAVAAAVEAATGFAIAQEIVVVIEAVIDRETIDRIAPPRINNQRCRHNRYSRSSHTRR
jgi:hypothetical protein